MKLSLRDPVLRLARQRIVRLSAEIEAELRSRQFHGPMLEILHRLRERAAESLAILAFSNLDDPAGLIEAKTLQNEVKRYDEMIGLMRDILHEGRDYDSEISAEEREELADMLMMSEEGRQEAVALGLVDDHAGE